MNELLERNRVINAKQNKFGLVIEQKQSRELKATITNRIIDCLKENFDIDTRMTSAGMFIEIPNENEGSIPVLLDIVMKPLDTDLETLEEEYKQKLKEKEEKEKEKQKKASILDD